MARPKAPKYPETAERLQKARSDKGWSQSVLAEKTKPFDGGLSAGAIGNYEQGTRRPNYRYARILEQVFDLPAAYFTGDISLREAEVIQTLRKKK